MAHTHYTLTLYPDLLLSSVLRVLEYLCFSHVDASSSFFWKVVSYFRMFFFS